MVEIAQQYESETTRKEYLDAAKQFRMPYWDYFRPRGGKVTFPGIINKEKGTTTYPFDYSAPRIFTDEKIMLRQPPLNKSEPITNPFWHFVFSKHGGTLQDNEWSFMDGKNEKESTVLNHSQTSRHPFPGNAQLQDIQWDNPARLNTVLNEVRMDSNRVALLMLSKLEQYRDYDSFACAGAEVGEEPPENEKERHLMWEYSGSLEQIHNIYHGLIGGLGPGGHMSRVPTAAFDPIFWFHHNQIERIFSIWQSIHKGEAREWFKNPDEANKPLNPFFQGINGNKPTFWSSEFAKDNKTFGYGYDDIKDTPDETMARLEYLYRWSVPKRDLEDIGQPPEEMKPLPLSESEFFNIPRATTAALLSETEALRLDPVLEKRIAALTVAPIEPLPEDTDIWEWQIGDQVRR